MTDKIPPEEAWDNLVDSFLDEEADRVAKMTREELDADLRAKGADPAVVAAKGRALVARLEAAKSREAPAPPAPAKPPLRLVRKARPWTTRVPSWTVPATLAAGVALFVASELAPVAEVAVTTPSTVPPPPVSSAPPQPSPLELATTYRKQAAASCDAGRWVECRGKLDDAWKLDPAGDDAPDVEALRRRANDGLVKETERYRAK